MDALAAGSSMWAHVGRRCRTWGRGALRSCTVRAQAANLDAVDSRPTPGRHRRPGRLLGRHTAYLSPISASRYVTFQQDVMHRLVELEPASGDATWPRPDGHSIPGTTKIRRARAKEEASPALARPTQAMHRVEPRTRQDRASPRAGHRNPHRRPLAGPVQRGQAGSIRRSVLTRSPAPFWISQGAITTYSCPGADNRR